MKEVILYADATFGLKVSVGERVNKGDELGIAIETGEILLSPIAGIIEKISFNPERHTFIITIVKQ